MFQLVFVLGPGRSGTSVVTQLLGRIGVTLSDDLVPANADNQTGYWEDRFVVDTHRTLLRALGRDDLESQCIPLPEGWLDRAEAGAAEEVLVSYVRSLRDSAEQPWGIKDPRLCQLLPLWLRVCSRLEVRHRVVLSLRSPASVASSVARAYDRDPAIGHALWLNRVAHALHHVQCAPFVTHYEQLLEAPDRAALALGEFVHGPDGGGLSDRDWSDVVRPDLNRTGQPGTTGNDLLDRLHAALASRSGRCEVDAELRSLMDEYFAACRANADWLACIASRQAQIAQMQSNLEAQRAIASDMKHLRRQEKSLMLAALRERNESNRAAEKLAASVDTQRTRAEDSERERFVYHMALLEERRMHRHTRKQVEDASRAQGRLARLAHTVAEKVPSAKANLDRIASLEAKIAELDALLEETAAESKRAQGRADRRKAAAEDLERRLRNRRRDVADAKAGSARLAWALKREMVDQLSPALKPDPEGVYNLAFPLAERELPLPRRVGGRRLRVLYVGPAGFRPEVWDTRVKYIFPDLFEEIADVADLYMLTGPVPPFARPGMEVLRERFGLTALEVPRTRYTASNPDFWMCEVLRVANRIQPDVITNVFGATVFGYGMGMAARATGARAVIRIAGDEIATKRVMGWYEEREFEFFSELFHQNIGFALSHAVIAMAPWEQQRVRDVVTDEAKVHVCLRGIDIARFPPVRRDPQRRPTRFLYVGRKSFEKGYDILEAAATLVADRAPEIQFVFAGNFPEKTEGNVTYTGFVQPEDLPALYADADAFMLVSRTEGFPQAMAEAMASGLPCILSELPFSHMFEHDEDVLLSPLDPEAVAATVIRLHEDPALATRLGTRAREIAETRIDRTLWQGAYRDVLLGDLADALPAHPDPASDEAHEPEPASCAVGEE